MENVTRGKLCAIDVMKDGKESSVMLKAGLLILIRMMEIKSLIQIKECTKIKAMQTNKERTNTLQMMIIKLSPNMITTMITMKTFSMIT